MSLDVEKVITDKADETRKTFRALLDKTNKEHPNPKDVSSCRTDGFEQKRVGSAQFDFACVTTHTAASRSDISLSFPQLSRF